ncbi:MAG: cyclic pyranopterin monophosphate synthase MoaC [Bdellovibrionales bacterium]|nr:cyclic pyranopterin monophosphate synthase MoaC [Bdellovibrionales bacterium]
MKQDQTPVFSHTVNQTMSHIDKDLNPTMVDVSEKKQTLRMASARSVILFPEEVMKCVQGNDIQSPKGSVIHTAIVGGTQAVKKTWELIPFCHPLMIESIKFSFQFKDNELILECTVKNTGKTGVEMEALTGASVAALIVYDMCKAMSHNIIITQTVLLVKQGGKSDVCFSSL